MTTTARKKPVHRTTKSVSRRAASTGKVRKEFWLDPSALSDAQSFLGTSSERETVEIALELVAFRRDLSIGAKALAGMRLKRID